jgi:hypothetical protein
MDEKHPKRPRDPNQLAKSVVDLATGVSSEGVETGLVKRAKAGGKKGGPARHAALRLSKGRKLPAAADARWKKR